MKTTKAKSKNKKSSTYNAGSRSAGATGYAPGLYMRYFVLKPSGGDFYARASRIAMRAYANAIQDENRNLADEMREWADREWMALPETQRAGEALNAYLERRG